MAKLNFDAMNPSGLVFVVQTKGGNIWIGEMIYDPEYDGVKLRSGEGVETHIPQQAISDTCTGQRQGGQHGEQGSKVT